MKGKKKKNSPVNARRRTAVGAVALHAVAEPAEAAVAAAVVAGALLDGVSGQLYFV